MIDPGTVSTDYNGVLRRLFGARGFVVSSPQETVNPVIEVGPREPYPFGPAQRLIWNVKQAAIAGLGSMRRGFRWPAASTNQSYGLAIVREVCVSHNGLAGNGINIEVGRCAWTTLIGDAQTTMTLTGYPATGNAVPAALETMGAGDTAAGLELYGNFYAPTAFTIFSLDLPIYPGFFPLAAGPRGFYLTANVEGAAAITLNAIAKVDWYPDFKA